MIRKLILLLTAFASLIMANLARANEQDWDDWAPLTGHNGNLICYSRARFWVDSESYYHSEVQVQNALKVPDMTFYLDNKTTGKDSCEGEITIPPGEVRGTYHLEHIDKPMKCIWHFSCSYQG